MDPGSSVTETVLTRLIAIPVDPIASRAFYNMIACVFENHSPSDIGFVCIKLEIRAIPLNFHKGACGQNRIFCAENGCIFSSGAHTIASRLCAPRSA